MTQTGLKVGAAATKPAGWRAAMCRCDCGEDIAVTVSGLVGGKNKSCGCLKREAANLQTPKVVAKTKARQTTHGLNAHPLYDTWYHMMRRCYDPKSPAFGRYGGRGIQVHDAWHDPAAFIGGVEAGIGPRPEGRYPSGQPMHTLDRINNDGNYEPGNVRWATAAVQQNNKSKPPECSEDECSQVARGRGMCKRHYQQWYRRYRAQAA